MGQQACHGPLHRLCRIKRNAPEVCAAAAPQAPSDLILQKSISLTEALTGLNFHVRHLDGRVLQVGRTPVLRTSAVLFSFVFPTAVNTATLQDGIRAGPVVRVPLERFQQTSAPGPMGGGPAANPLQ